MQHSGAADGPVSATVSQIHAGCKQTSSSAAAVDETAGAGAGAGARQQPGRPPIARVADEPAAAFLRRGSRGWLSLSRASSGADRAVGTGLRKRGRRRPFHAGAQASGMLRFDQKHKRAERDVSGCRQDRAGAGRAPAFGRGCRTNQSRCTKVTTAFFADVTGAPQAAEPDSPRPKRLPPKSSLCRGCTKSR